MWIIYHLRSKLCLWTLIFIRKDKSKILLQKNHFSYFISLWQIFNNRELEHWDSKMHLWLCKVFWQSPKDIFYFRRITLFQSQLCLSALRGFFCFCFLGFFYEASIRLCHCGGLLVEEPDQMKLGNGIFRIRSIKQYIISIKCYTVSSIWDYPQSIFEFQSMDSSNDSIK